MKKLVLCLIVIFVFIGCSLKVKDIILENFYTPDGTLLLKVKCRSNYTNCLNEAHKICNNGGYQVISSESHAGDIFTDITLGPVTWYSMIFKCGEGDGVLPDFKFTGEHYVPPTIIETNTLPSTSIPIQKMQMTNCNKVGDSVFCTTY